MGPLAAAIPRPPVRALTVVGVTGTNGKTTTTHLLRSVFEAAGRRAAVIGTLTAAIPAPAAPRRTRRRSRPQPRATLRDDGVEVVAMEVSSHGLALHRVDGTRFAVAVFTNLSQDHLDLHGTMEAYFAAKARLFDSGVRRPRRRRTSTTRTAGCSATRRRSRPSATRSTTSTSSSSTVDGSTFTWRGGPMSACRSPAGSTWPTPCAPPPSRPSSASRPTSPRGLAATPPVPGRFEPVDAGQPFGVVVDYAHTPDGLAHVLDAAREIAGGGRVLVVFGAGGDRDPGKRPRMGEVAGRLADVVVHHVGQPAERGPAGDHRRHRAGIAPADADKVTVEPDRRAAIARAVQSAPIRATSC